jgi:hypothetical protein
MAPPARVAADAMFSIHPHKRWVDVWVGNVARLASLLSRAQAGVGVEDVLSFMLHEAISAAAPGCWRAHGKKWAEDLSALLSSSAPVEPILARWDTREGILSHLTTRVAPLGHLGLVTVQGRKGRLLRLPADPPVDRRPAKMKNTSWRMVVLTLPFPIAVDLAHFLAHHGTREDAETGQPEVVDAGPSPGVMKGIFATLSSHLGKVLWPDPGRLPAALLQNDPTDHGPAAIFQRERARLRIAGIEWPDIEKDRMRCEGQSLAVNFPKDDDAWLHASKETPQLSFSFLYPRFIRQALPASLRFGRDDVMNIAETDVNPANAPWGPYFLATGGLGNDDTGSCLAQRFLDPSPPPPARWAPIGAVLLPWPARKGGRTSVRLTPGSGSAGNGPPPPGGPAGKNPGSRSHASGPVGSSRRGDVQLLPRDGSATSPARGKSTADRSRSHPAVPLAPDNSTPGVARDHAASPGSNATSDAPCARGPPFGDGERGHRPRSPHRGGGPPIGAPRRWGHHSGQQRDHRNRSRDGRRPGGDHTPRQFQ